MKNVFYFHKNNHINHSSGVNKLSKRQLRKMRSYTIAAVVDGYEMRFGLSECSVNDAFNKKKGRTIAEGRARSNSLNSRIIEIQPNAEIGKLFTSNAVEILSNL